MVGVYDPGDGRERCSWSEVEDTLPPGHQLGFQSLNGSPLTRAPVTYRLGCREYEIVLRFLMTPAN